MIFKKKKILNSESDEEFRYKGNSIEYAKHYQKPLHPDKVMLLSLIDSCKSSLIASDCLLKETFNRFFIKFTTVLIYVFNIFLGLN